MNLNLWTIIQLVLVWIRSCKPLWQRGNGKCNNHNDSKAAMLQSAAIYTGVRLSRALSRPTRGLSTFDTRQPAKFKSPGTNFRRRLRLLFFAFLCLLWSCVVFLSIYVVLLRAMWLLIFICYLLLSFLSISRRKSSDVQTQAK